MKSRPADDRDEEIARLRSKVGQLTMDVELLGQKCQHPGERPPFCPEEAQRIGPLRLPRHRQAIRPPAGPAASSAWPAPTAYYPQGP